MALISQVLAVSYSALANVARKPENQWSENALMREFERQGMIERKSLGPTIEATLDYRANPGAGFLASDLAPVSLVKTEVFTAASYTPAQISVPMVWSKMDEVVNPSENQKIDFVKNLVVNGFTTHDNKFEQALFDDDTNGFLGLLTIVPTTGLGTVGTIDSSAETMWRNYAGTYLSDGSNIESSFTTAHNTAAKGSGGSQPKLMVSGMATHGLYHSTLTPNQRFMDSDKVDAGFKIIAFLGARYVFSQYGGTPVYFLNPKNLKLIVSKEYFRQRGDTNEIDDANGFVTKIYSAGQLVTNAKSRLAVVEQA